MPGIGRPFLPGNTFSKGRPPGRKNKLTIFREALDKGATAIIRVVKEQALKRDPVAMKLCMERLVPVPKTPTPRFQLPTVYSAADLAPAIGAVTKAVAEGWLSAQDGESVARIIECHRRTLEAEDFERRLRVLEEG